MLLNISFFLMTGQNSDIVIIIGEERILAHTLVFISRCPTIYNEIIEAKGMKYLEIWSHLKKDVVVAFLSYLYSGIVELELITNEDHESAKYFCHNYPTLENWRLYMENYIDQTP